MKKAVIGVTFLFTSFMTHANGTLTYLKQAPATKYEVAKIQLDLFAFALTKELKDQRMQGTSFKISGFSVKDSETSLRLVGKLIGKAKELTSEQCSNFKTNFEAHKLFNNITMELWPNLSSEQYKELEGVIGVSIRLISEENESFTIDC